MAPTTSSRSSRSSSHSSSNRKPEPLLPYSFSADKKPVMRLGSTLRPSLYRRALLWVLIILALLSVIIYQSKHSNVYDAALKKWGEQTGPSGFGGQNPGQGQDSGRDQLSEEVDAQNRAKQESSLLKVMPWLRFPHLDGYYHGLRTLVPKANLVPEYPNETWPAPLPAPPMGEGFPTPKPYDPVLDRENLKPCYLDKENKVPAPDLYAYEGVPQHMPDPVIGSYSLVGIRDDICFDRFGRYGAYGLGYQKEEGGQGVGVDTEAGHNEAVWSKSGRIDYRNVNWGDAQERCYQANEARYNKPDPVTSAIKHVEGKKARMAIVIRCYTGFRWTDLAILNFRAMINELSLKAGGEYTVHFLLHVRDVDEPIWSDSETVQRILIQNMPAEFHGMVTLWSEPQMRLHYPGQFEEAVQNPSRADIHGVYRSAHLPLQIFAMEHPQYEHIWNWEMDMRYLGSYYELFDRLGKFADKQPRVGLWERNERYYIPSYHKSWENFTKITADDALKSGKPIVFGRMQFPELSQLRSEQRGEKMWPVETCEGDDKSKCGVGEAADIITLNPIFDTEQSGWVFQLDITGYGKNPPRRCAIVTASRLSRRLLEAMHENVWRFHHSAFSEMYPATVALHHGMKGVYAPHPVFIDRAWDPKSVDAAFNGGRDHSTSGLGSPYDLKNEHNHKGSTWYFNSEFAGLLWRRWLGYEQKDGRSTTGGFSGEGKMRGGYQEEANPSLSGRLCMRNVLLHPIKHEHPSELAPQH